MCMMYCVMSFNPNEYFHRSFSKVANTSFVKEKMEILFILSAVVLCK